MFFGDRTQRIYCIIMKNVVWWHNLYIVVSCHNLYIHLWKKMITLIYIQCIYNDHTYICTELIYIHLWKRWSHLLWWSQLIYTLFMMIITKCVLCGAHNACHFTCHTAPRGCQQIGLFSDKIGLFSDALYRALFRIYFRWAMLHHLPHCAADVCINMPLFRQNRALFRRTI